MKQMFVNRNWESESTCCRGRAIDPWHWQLEKVVYPDENSWNHTKIIQMAKQFEQKSGQNECCSALSPHLVPT